MQYILPKDVTAPKDHWTLLKVLVEGKAGKPAYALGTWYGKRCIGARTAVRLFFGGIS
jgi:predicted Abi (CAAX) family protease